MDTSAFEIHPGSVLMVVATMMVAYISGRLDRIEKNKKLLLIVAIIIVIDAVVHIIEMSAIAVPFYAAVAVISTLVHLAAISFAYTARYEQHKAAGFEDER